MDLHKFIAGASILLKSLIAIVLLIITAFIVLIMLAMAEEWGVVTYVCFGPFALVFGIFFLITIIWILQELKGEIGEKPKIEEKKGKL